MTFLGRFEELVSRCVECDLAEPESLASLGGSAPGVVDGILSVNKTPVVWYSKKQASVGTATYGSEFVAAKTATEQIMDIRHTLRYLGAPIGAISFLFGDNRSVVSSATLPHSTLTKRHNILAFHRVREAIAAKLMAFYWIQSVYNSSDMQSNHWNHPIVYPMILKLFITRGNTILIPKEATQEKEKGNLKLQPEKLK